jgi:DNA repair exonuclease SbcCD ATPase subunit
MFIANDKDLKIIGYPQSLLTQDSYQVAKTFIKQFVAMVKGDEAEAIAAKVQRKAIAALDSELANLKGELVDKEQALEDANENLSKAILNNGNEISDRKYYVQGLIKAKAQITEAQDSLEDLKHTISVLEGILTKVKA